MLPRYRVQIMCRQTAFSRSQYSQSSHSLYKNSHPPDNRPSPSWTNPAELTEAAAPVDTATLLVGLTAPDVAKPWLRDADPVAAADAEEEVRAAEDATPLEAIEDDIVEDDATALDVDAEEPPAAALPDEPSAPRTPP